MNIFLTSFFIFIVSRCFAEEMKRQRHIKSYKRELLLAYTENVRHVKSHVLCNGKMCDDGDDDAQFYFRMMSNVMDDLVRTQTKT